MSRKVAVITSEPELRANGKGKSGIKSVTKLTLKQQVRLDMIFGS